MAVRTCGKRLIRNMIYELEDTSLASGLFDGWQETLIWSCLQKVMGKVFVTDPARPESAMAFVGCFAFVAGKPDRELVLAKPEGFVIMTPQNEAWAGLIEECFPDAKRLHATRSGKIPALTKTLCKKSSQAFPRAMN